MNTFTGGRMILRWRCTLDLVVAFVTWAFNYYAPTFDTAPTTDYIDKIFILSIFWGADDGDRS